MGGAAVEILYAYALLWSEGYDFGSRYAEELDRLFDACPDNDEYLYLEGVSDPKEAALHIIATMADKPSHTDVFGRALMEGLASVWQTYAVQGDALRSFAAHMVSLWHKLPERINRLQPFHVLSYADEPLSWGDEAQCRALYEQAFQYYHADNENQTIKQ